MKYLPWETTRKYNSVTLRECDSEASDERDSDMQEKGALEKPLLEEAVALVENDIVLRALETVIKNGSITLRETSFDDAAFQLEAALIVHATIGGK